MTDREFEGVWAMFPEGTLPCVSCGIAVPTHPEDADVLDVALGVVRGEHLGNGEYRMMHSSKLYPVTRCATCRQIRASASDLLSAHPEVRAAIGSRVIALHQVECALLGLDAIGVAAPRVIDRHTASARALRRLVYTLRYPGAAARWEHQAATRRADNVRDAVPSETRWEHVTSEQRRSLNEAYVELFMATSATPRRIVPVDESGRDTGCMLCGVGSWDAVPSRADTVWTETSTDPETVGGRISPTPLYGVVCPRCDRAIDTARSVGQSALRVSVLDYLRVDLGPRWDAIAPDFNVVAWGVLPSRVTPNTEPWGHVDLAALRELLVGRRVRA